MSLLQNPRRHWSQDTEETWGGIIVKCASWGFEEGRPGLDTRVVEDTNPFLFLLPTTTYEK